MNPYLHAVFYHARTRSFNRLSRQELLDGQWERVRKIVSYAYEHVPCYRDLWRRHDVTPSAIRDPRDLRLLPVVTKRDLRERYPAGAVSDLFRTGHYREFRTSGSTGQPFRFAKDLVCVGKTIAVNYRTCAVSGYRLQKRVVQAAAPILDDDGWVPAMVNRLLRRRMVDIFAPDYRATLRLLSDYRPEYMVGSGSYFSLLAREALRVGWRPSKPVRAVMTTSETLYADMRATISEVFDAEVYDQYGSREFGRIGSECELHEGYHINTDVVYLEVLALDSDEAVRQGQRGRLVVTGLTNHAMPMIRYDIGDLASLSSHHCACGRASPLLTDLGGRLQDILWHSDHSPRPPGFVGVLLRESDHIVDFQLVQESYDLVVLRFVADRELPSEALQHIREGLRTYLGCQVAFEQVDTISRVAGKFKRIISHVRG